MGINAEYMGTPRVAFVLDTTLHYSSLLYFLYHRSSCLGTSRLMLESRLSTPFLEEHSYIEGFVPSQADTAVFNGLGKAPAYPHALRWYNHIKSFGEGMKQFAKASKAAGDYLGGAAPAADDDD